jgi:hypothetical protein
MAGYGLGPYGSGPYGGGQPAPPSGPVGVYQGFVTGSVTATTTGVTLPAELIVPAPGLAGLVTLVNGGVVSVMVAGPASGPFALPPDTAVGVELPAGRLVVSTSSGTAPVSYAYAGR